MESTSDISEGLLLGIGNPLLDISANVDVDLLYKYDLKTDDAIMAEEKHMPIYRELIEKYNAEFIAGGSVQNSMRVAQWIIKKPGVCTYFGCVGNDDYARILKERAIADGVNVQYQICNEKPTGTCAVLVTGTHRSLCANLAAAQCFTPDHLDKDVCRTLVQKAKYFYVSVRALGRTWNCTSDRVAYPAYLSQHSSHIVVGDRSEHYHRTGFRSSSPVVVKPPNSPNPRPATDPHLVPGNHGFFVAVSPEAILQLGKHALDEGHFFIMNLSAPFVSQFFKEPLAKIIPYVDILFGNETEAVAFANAFDIRESDCTEIALKIAALPKHNSQKKRVVIITQGSEAVILIENGQVNHIPVMKLSREEIVDTNGAGDAFTGGFLGQLVLGKSYSTCVKCGIYAATHVIQHSGCTFSGESYFKES